MVDAATAVARRAGIGDGHSRARIALELLIREFESQKEPCKPVDAPTLLIEKLGAMTSAALTSAAMISAL